MNNIILFHIFNINIVQFQLNALLLFQTCLLCKVQLQNTEELITHFVEVHVKEYVHGEQSFQYNDCDYLSPGKRKKSLPNLLKISDLKRTDLPGNILYSLYKIKCYFKYN